MDWRPLPYSKKPTRLYVGEIEVARLCSRMDGTFNAALNQHMPLADPHRRVIDCTSEAQGKAALEIWATRHAWRLQREVTARWGIAKDRI